MHRNGPVTLTSKWRLQDASVVLASGALSAKPALLTSTSTSPIASNVSVDGGLVGHVADVRCRRRSGARAPPVAPERDHARRRAPRTARRSRGPMPLAPPVTTTVRLTPDHRHQPLHLREPLGVAPDEELQRHVLGRRRRRTGRAPRPPARGSRAGRSGSCSTGSSVTSTDRQQLSVDLVGVAARVLARRRRTLS